MSILAQAATVANTHANQLHADEIATLRDEMQAAFWPMTPGIEAGQPVAPEHRDRWATVLAPDWTPEQATEGNGAVPSFPISKELSSTVGDWRESSRCSRPEDSRTSSSSTSGICGSCMA